MGIVRSALPGFAFFQFETLFLPSHTLSDTVQMCIKYKVYGLLHIYGKQDFH